MAGHVNVIAPPDPAAERQDRQLRLEMSAEIVFQLLTKGCLCAADFRCLDPESHCQIRELLLQSCLEKERWKCIEYLPKQPGRV